MNLNVNLHNGTAGGREMFAYSTVTNASSANEITHKRSEHK